MQQKPTKSFLIDDLKNVNGTLLRSSRSQDFYLDNHRGREDDDHISIEEEMDNEAESDFQLDSLEACRSSISTVEDLSIRVKSEIVKENCSRENSSVKTKIQVKNGLNFTKHSDRITTLHHFGGQSFL